MKAMIFAAGLGTRLKPLTDSMPKALVPVSGEPLLKHVADRLQQAGVNDFVVNVHHFAGMIKDYVACRDWGGAGFSISDESGCLLDTGGGILNAEDMLTAGEPEDGFFLVHNVDILSDLDISHFIQSWTPGALAVLLVSGRKTQRYLLFDDDMRLAGWTNVATGEVRTPYPSLQVDKCRKLAFSGIHLISNSVFDVMKEEGFSGRFPIMDFYLKVCDRYPVYGYAPDSLNILDVGKTDSLPQAEEFILRTRRCSPEVSEG